MPAPIIDENKYKAATQFFGDENIMVQVAYKRTVGDGFGDSFIEGYLFNELEPDLQYEKKWSVDHEIMWAMQGAAFNGVNCYVAVGVPHGDAKIYKIDTTKGVVTCFINFRDGEDTLKEEEMQGIAFYECSLYFSTTYGVYKVL